MSDNIPYVEKMINVGDIEIGVKAEPFKVLDINQYDDGNLEIVSRMFLSLKSKNKQVVGRFSEVFYRTYVKIYDENGNDISNMPRRAYFPSDHFKDEILHPNAKRELVFLAYAKYLNYNSSKFINVEVIFSNQFSTWTHPFKLKVRVPVNKNFN